jgi:iron-sulfur cluster repair protein YtfE (RIC family)
MVQALEEFEMDLHQRIQLENKILLLQTVALEAGA